MRFLADESCDFAIVRALRAEGFDVLAISELSPRASDETVIDLAVRENRVLLTEDKDFGQARLCERPAVCGGDPRQVSGQCTEAAARRGFGLYP